MNTTATRGHGQPSREPIGVSPLGPVAGSPGRRSPSPATWPSAANGPAAADASRRRGSASRRRRRPRRRPCRTAPSGISAPSAVASGSRPVRRRPAAPSPPGARWPADEDRGDAGDADEQPDEQEDSRRPDPRPAIGPDDEDRQEARDRHEHVQDAEHAAADLLGEVLLELRLGRDRDEARRRCRRRTRTPTTSDRSDVTADRSGQARSPRSRCEEVADLARAAAIAARKMPSAMRPPSMTRRRGTSRP